MLDILKKSSVVDLFKQERFSEMFDNPEYAKAYFATKTAIKEVQKEMKGRPPGFRTHAESLALNMLFAQTGERTQDQVTYVDVAFKHIRNTTQKKEIE